MRTAIAGLIGGIVFFMWGAAAHMALPIGEMGMKVPTAQKETLAAIAPSVQGEGVYMYPSLPSDQWGDAAAVKRFTEDNAGSAYAFVIWQPGGNPVHASMGPALGKQFVSDVLSALLVAWVLAMAPIGFGKRVLAAAALGLFSWFTVSVPWWNWYMFPLDFTIGSLLEQVLGWTIAGAAIAWWLGRGAKPA